MPPFNLDSAVGRALMVQHIGLSGESEKIDVTLLVTRLFSDLPGESRGCASDVRTTAESRFNNPPLLTPLQQKTFNTL
jgi:hypothetical protein